MKYIKTDKDFKIIITFIFILAYIAGWSFNGAYGANFDLLALTGLYGCLVGKDLYTHTVDSLFNSEKGKPPIFTKIAKGVLKK